MVVHRLSHGLGYVIGSIIYCIDPDDESYPDSWLRGKANFSLYPKPADGSLEQGHRFLQHVTVIFGAGDAWVGFVGVIRKRAMNDVIEMIARQAQCGQT